MTRFNFDYVMDSSKDVYGVDLSVHNEAEDFTADEMCDAFLQFMISAGYSTECVYEYFRINAGAPKKE